MRKIEKAMLEAIKARKNWSLDNTRVEFCPVMNSAYYGVSSGGNLVGRVELHGHLIATVTPSGEIKPYSDTFRRWPTMTTASRLRALGIDASIRQGRAYIDGQLV